MIERVQAGRALQGIFNQVLWLIGSPGVDAHRLPRKERGPIVIDPDCQFIHSLARKRLPDGKQALRVGALLFRLSMTPFGLRHQLSRESFVAGDRRFLFCGHRELLRRLRAIAVCHRFPLCAAREVCLPQTCNNAQDQNSEHGDNPQYQGFVAAREFLKLITGAWRTRHDRLVSKIASDVRGQFRRGSVAPGLVFLERLGRDSLDVTAKVPIDGA